MCDGIPNSYNRRLGCGFVSHQHLQCSWVWAGISGRAPSHETGPLNRQHPGAPRCCRPFPDSACAFVLLGCGWCSALHRGTRTPSPSDHWDQHLEIEHMHKVCSEEMHMTNITKQIFVHCPVSLQLAHLATWSTSVHLPHSFYCRIHISLHMCTFLRTYTWICLVLTFQDPTWWQSSVCVL